MHEEPLGSRYGSVPILIYSLKVGLPGTERSRSLKAGEAEEAGNSVFTPGVSRQETTKANWKAGTQFPRSLPPDGMFSIL